MQMRHATALLFAACLATVPARAQTFAEAVPMSQGLICNTVDETKAFLMLIEAKETPQAATEMVAGCGFVNQPLVVTITALEKFETNGFAYLLVRYDILGMPEPQYGVFHRIQLTRA